MTEAAPYTGNPDAGSVAVGDTTLTAAKGTVEAPSNWKVIAKEVPQKPFPGQVKPDANGRCPWKGLVIINGGCWVGLELDGDACQELGYLHKGKCYAPAYPHGRQPTSTPPTPR